MNRILLLLFLVCAHVCGAMERVPMALAPQAVMIALAAQVANNNQPIVAEQKRIKHPKMPKKREQKNHKRPSLQIMHHLKRGR